MFLHIIPRKIAKERGFVRYFTGDLCAKKLHIAERNTKSSTCLVCDREKSRSYRALNPEKARETLRKSYAKNADKRRAWHKIFREKNKEKLKEAKRRYVDENREKVAKSKNKYYLENKAVLLEQGKAHRLANIDRYKEVGRIWRENNRDIVRLNNRNRKRKIRAAGGSHSIEDIKNLKKIQKMTCASCYEKFKGNNYHVDHIYPLALGGSNDRSNLQLLCPPCNMSKGSKLPEDFYQERGFLL